MSAVVALEGAGPDRGRPDLWLFAGALALANITLLQGRAAEALLFFPAAVGGGEWWRLLTFPWAHVSWYHLLLDGVAFFLLYGALREESAARRLLLLAAAGGGSLLAALACAPEVLGIGLGGLSGIDHGLMAFGALEGLAGADPRARRQGGWLLGAVAIKAALEALTGRVLLGPFHFGLMGVPVAACHLGGVLGGAAAFLAFRWVDGAPLGGRGRRTPSRP